MALSEKLLGIEEFISNQRMSQMRAAAFKMYIRWSGDKPYQTPERWEVLLREYDTRNINNQNDNINQ